MSDTHTFPSTPSTLPQSRTFSQSERYSSRSFIPSPLHMGDTEPDQYTSFHPSENTPRSANSTLSTPASTPGIPRTPRSARRVPSSIVVLAREKRAVNLTRSYACETTEGLKPLASFDEGIESGQSLVQELQFEWSFIPTTSDRGVCQ